MADFPPCRWAREPIGEDRRGCVSPKLVTGPRGVHLSTCQHCYCRDHPARPAPAGLCRHLGPRLGVEVCPVCPHTGGQPVQIPVHECRIHGRCTLAFPLSGLSCCTRCPDSSPATPGSSVGSVRHMTYFVCPLGQVWQWNLRELRKRISLFNGRRLVFAVEGGGLAPRNVVEHELEGCGVEWIWAANDPALKEYVGFPHLMRSLSQYASEADVTWYGHAKGVSSEGWGSGVRRWTSSMYSALLDYWPEVQRQLQSHAAVGVWKKRQGWFPANGSTWHYMGSHRWIRNRDLYARRWDEYIVDWCCPEAHVGGVLRWEEAACLYGEQAGGPPDLYLAGAWDGWYGEQRRSWEEAHIVDRQTPVLVSVVICSHQKPQLVHQAIRSVIAQTTDSWRLVVIDSGPLIDAGEFRGRYSGDPRISCIRSGEDRLAQRPGCPQGWCHNRARDAGMIVGDLVCYLSDDDCYAPGALQQWIDAARAHPDQSAWMAPAERVRVDADGAETLLGRLDPPAGSGADRPLAGVVDGMQVCCRRSVLPAWPEDAASAPRADGVWLDALGAAVPIHPLPALCGRHRHTPFSTYTRE